MTTSGAEPARRLVLDTSAYSRFRRGNDQVLDLVAAAESVLLSAVTLGELEAGFELGSRPRENRVALAEFLGETFVSILHVTADVARRYGEVFAQLKTAGTPVPVNDIWIAASTIDRGAHLLTFDRHFEKITSVSRTILQS